MVWMIFLFDLAIFGVFWTLLTPMFVWMAPRPLTLLSRGLLLVGFTVPSQFLARLSTQVGLAWSRARDGVESDPDE